MTQGSNSDKEIAAYGHRETLCKRLRRWADARDKRLAAGGHAGITGTELLREAADRIEELEMNVELDSEEFEGGYPWPNI